MKTVKALLGVAYRGNYRPSITGVYVNDGFAVATNGSLLVRVPCRGNLAPGIYGNEKLRDGEYEYPDYKQIIPTYSKHSLPMGAATTLALSEAIRLNKESGATPGRKEISRHIGNPLFTSIRFEAGGEFYHFDPFLLWAGCEALRKAGYHATAIELTYSLSAAKIVTDNPPDAIGVIMPIRAKERFVAAS